MTVISRAKGNKNTSTLSVRLEEQTERSLEIRALALSTSKSVVARQLIHDGLQADSAKTTPDESLNIIKAQLDESLQKIDALIELAVSAAQLLNSSPEDQ